MSMCIRCRRQYNEPADEQGDHDCPHCGLSPRQRDSLVINRATRRLSRRGAGVGAFPPDGDEYLDHDSFVGWDIGDQ